MDLTPEIRCPSISSIGWRCGEQAGHAGAHLAVSGGGSVSWGSRPDELAREYGEAFRAAYRAGREDAARALEEKIIAGVAIPEPILESLRTGFITAKPFREWVAAIARGEDAQPRCLCPDCDVTAVGELPRSRTVKGLDPDCPIHGPISLGRSAGHDGDNPSEQP